MSQTATAYETFFLCSHLRLKYVAGAHVHLGNSSSEFARWSRYCQSAWRYRGHSVFANTWNSGHFRHRRRMASSSRLHLLQIHLHQLQLLTNYVLMILLGLAVCPSLLQLVLFAFCPESPRYLLITANREEEARTGKPIYFQCLIKN